ncbi:NAD(P)-binding protein [Trametopsis cervina]|nr:NAD(P)-binding protein [Trametopsis cervina]
MSEPTVFLLGATGYLGSEFLKLLAKEYPKYPVNALLRNATDTRKASLHNIHPNLTVTEGTLEDVAIIEEAVLKADIVVNVASSDHWPSVKATLDGLEKSSSSRPGNPPLYIHISGCGIVSDNARGQGPVTDKVWSDIGLDLNDCDPINTHLPSDKPIVAAGTRKENPVRTIIIYPCQIYGVGNGIQPTSLWLRIFLQYARNLGYAGTWGAGLNGQNTIHLQDMADICLLIFKAALEGKADEGAEGLYFAATDTTITYGEWARKMGDHLYQKGLLKEPGAKPMPDEVVEPLGHYGWSLLGGNMYVKADRLARLGWKPVHSNTASLLDTLPEAINAYLADAGWTSFEPPAAEATTTT